MTGNADPFGGRTKTFQTETLHGREVVQACVSIHLASDVSGSSPSVDLQPMRRPVRDVDEIGVESRQNPPR